MTAALLVLSGGLALLALLAAAVIIAVRTPPFPEEPDA